MKTEHRGYSARMDMVLVEFCAIESGGRAHEELSSVLRIEDFYALNLRLGLLVSPDGCRLYVVRHLLPLLESSLMFHLEC